MCGIVGQINFHQEVISKPEFNRFCASLNHRGPDNRSVYFDESGRVALGHTRLAVVDFDQNSNQPFVSNDGRYVITFNGEIYNYLELQQELLSVGYQFRTNSDTEVILHAFDLWREACLNKFNGMWAFAIWDRQNNRLFAARDRFGVKPFYYSLKSHGFAFASEQKAFAQLSSFDYSIDPGFAYVALQNSSHCHAYRDCLFTNIKKLMPGEYLTIEHNGEFKTTRWWDLLSSIENYSESNDEVFDNFQRACELRTRAKADIAFSLSGGMDSSAVTCYSVPFLNHGKRVKSFTGSFPGTALDEFNLAQDVAQAAKMQHERVVLEREWVNDNLLDCLLQTEDVLAVPPMGQWMIYSRMREDGFKVSIEGHAGDELFGGYFNHVQAYLGDVIEDGKNAQELAATINLIQDMRAAVGYANSTLPRLIRSSTAEFTSALSANKFASLFAVKENAFSPPPLLQKSSGKGGLFCSLFNDFCYLTLPAILNNYDKCSMGKSIEVRSPFMDYRMVLSAFSAGQKLKINQGMTKRFLRQRLDKVPSSVRTSPIKLGFNIPLATWLKEGLSEFVKDVVHDQRFLTNSLFDGRKALSLFEQDLNNQNWQGIVNNWSLVHLHILDAYGGKHGAC